MSLKPLLNSFLLGGFVSLTACNQYSSGGLVGDYQEMSKCPANGCANQEPSANNLKITNSGSSVSLYPSSTDTKVEISGDCYASTFPSNKINVSVVTQNGNVPMTAPVYAATGTTTTPSCVKGKYDVVVDIRNLGLNTIYTLKLELVAYDSKSTPFTNAGGGYLYLSLVR